MRIRPILLLIFVFIGVQACSVEPPSVTLIRTPNGGIQPQSAVDEDGTLHLVYFQGAPEAGDLFYVRKPSGSGRFSDPLRVNSQSGSAIAIGTIRGAQFALGGNGRVHVAWNGSGAAKQEESGRIPMLYTRLNQAGTAFEPQRDLITWAGGIDGGGAIAADNQGNVYVLWHAAPAGTDEANRGVYLAHSLDNGRSFDRERQVNPAQTGVCGCCGMKAHTDSAGNLYVLYRAATDNVNRDMTLLVSRDRGSTFDAATIDRWEATACPMSSSSFSRLGEDMATAWQTGEQVSFAVIPKGAASISDMLGAPGAPALRKHPVLAVSNEKALLFAWTEGTGWRKGGSLVWQVYDANGQALTEPAREEGVPVWSLPAAYYEPEKGFGLVY